MSERVQAAPASRGMVSREGLAWAWVGPVPGIASQPRRRLLRPARLGHGWPQHFARHHGRQRCCARALRIDRRCAWRANSAGDRVGRMRSGNAVDAGAAAYAADANMIAAPIVVWPSNISFLFPDRSSVPRNAEGRSEILNFPGSIYDCLSPSKHGRGSSIELILADQCRVKQRGNRSFRTYSTRGPA
jgi:hypothetical protein